MCGRYAFFSPSEAVTKLFDLDCDIPVQASYNVAPTDYAPVVRELDGHRKLSLLRWGLIPFWAKDRNVGVKMINARSETVAEKPAFRHAFRQRRCLIPANGFFEWQKTTAGKVPHFIRLIDEELFAFAGLWECWGQGEQQIESMTIITTQPNELVTDIHDRMPVILAPESYGAWLGEKKMETPELLSLLQSYRADAMYAYPVSKRVNNTRDKSEKTIVREQNSLF